MDSIIDKATTNAANQDMRIARKHGSVTITGTKRGNLELTYDRKARTYTLIKMGTAYPVYTEPETITTDAPARVIREELKKSYEIIFT